MIMPPANTRSESFTKGKPSKNSTIPSFFVSKASIKSKLPHTKTVALEIKGQKLKCTTPPSDADNKVASVPSTLFSQAEDEQNQSTHQSPKAVFVDTDRLFPKPLVEMKPADSIRKSYNQSPQPTKQKTVVKARNTQTKVSREGKKASLSPKRTQPIRLATSCIIDLTKSCPNNNNQEVGEWEPIPPEIIKMWDEKRRQFSLGAKSDPGPVVFKSNYSKKEGRKSAPSAVKQEPTSETKASSESGKAVVAASWPETPSLKSKHAGLENLATPYLSTETNSPFKPMICSPPSDTFATAVKAAIAPGTLPKTSADLCSLPSTKVEIDLANEGTFTPCTPVVLHKASELAQIERTGCTSVITQKPAMAMAMATHAPLPDIPVSESTPIKFCSVVDYSPLPEEGALCRVHCKSSESFWNRRRENGVSKQEEADWYPAVIGSVKWGWKKETATIQVTFFDKITTKINYTHPTIILSPESMKTANKDFEMLVPLEGSLTAFRTLWTKEKFYDREPRKVQAGDMVQAKFQNDVLWFCGRAAKVRKGTANGDVCDIIYDDGDYETDVPLTTENVHILQDGFLHPEWMIGLSFERKKGRGDKKEKCIVQEVTGGKSVKITVTDDNGSIRKGGSLSYSHAVHALMESTIAGIPANKRHQWPFVALEQPAKVSVVAKSQIERTSKRSWPGKNAQVSTARPGPKLAAYKNDEEQQASKRARTKKAPVPPEPNPAIAADNPGSFSSTKLLQIHGNEKNVSAGFDGMWGQESFVVSHADEKENENCNQPKPRQRRQPKSERPPPFADEGEKDKQTPPQPTKRTRKIQSRQALVLKHPAAPTINRKLRARKKKGATAHDLETISMEARLASLTIYSPVPAVPAAAACENTKKTSGELSAALGEALEDSLLHSSDTHLGELICFMSSHHNQMPGWDICRSLVTLLLHGPTSEGVIFPDCQRMERAEEFIQLCFHNHPSIFDRFLDCAGQSFWLDCLVCVEDPHYIVEGDKERKTNFAINRLAQSVHLKACCADFFLRILTHQLADCVTGSNVFNRDELLERKLIKEIVGHRKGPKEALERFWRALVNLWIELGPYVVGEPMGLFESENDICDDICDDSLHFLQEQSSRLLGILGKLASNLAWLHYFVEGESPTGIAQLFSNIAQFAIESSGFDGTRAILGLGFDEDKYWSGFRLRLVLDLDNRLVAEIRPILADLLGVGVAFSTIFAY